MMRTDFVSTIKHLIKNWYFPVSAMAFFYLNVRMNLLFSSALLAISLIIAMKYDTILGKISKENYEIQILSAFSAVGICWNGIRHIDCMNIAGAVMAFFFVYICVVTFWRNMANIFKDTGLFKDIRVGEGSLYILILIISVGLMAVVFMHSQAFYGTEYSYDIIYTSDSSILMKENVYLTLTHEENDLRQPLFAVFAAPFAAIPYLISRLLFVSYPMQAVLMNSVQIFLLLITNFMLAKMMKLSSGKRICFMIIASCTYTYLLFVLMMEQYIVTYFWLVFCLYLICEKKYLNRIAFWGASGTMLTNLVLIPFMSDTFPWRNLKKWFIDMFRYGLEFITVILFFGRFDIFIGLRSTYQHLVSFTGKNIPMGNKILQYIAFIRNYFMAPDADINFTAVDHVSWQLNPVKTVSFTGVAILLLAIVSIIINRKKKSSLLAGGWIMFSIIILVFLGWGTKENGLILYSLCFGWAFLVLLFQLVEQIEEMVHVKYLIPIITMGCLVMLATVNFPEIVKMVMFSVSYFPM